ncbi:hypothetical protein [Pacificispira sp.]|uniref:hypothetical protein n=1 Tax=Pacificispira sp. TaxID=2888761 RepID=UPI003BAA52E5
MTTTFETGKTYYCRSVCDHDCIWTFTVERRSQSSVWLTDRRGNTKRRTIKVGAGTEFCFPLGRYSMAPVLSADREQKEAA